MDPLTLTLLALAGFAGGAISAVAGGATFFTFPALIAAGLSPLQANVTNFVALMPSNFAALPAFREELATMGRALVAPGLIAVAGSLCGVALLFALGPARFSAAVPWLMGGATLLFATAPLLRRRLARWLPAGNGPVAGVLLFGFAIYGGYFGAGLGQIMLAALAIWGIEDLRQANAVKNALNALMSIASGLIYALSGAVAWPAALVMIVGATAGGYLGGRWSRIVPQRPLRRGIIAFGVVLTALYFARGT